MKVSAYTFGTGIGSDALILGLKKDECMRHHRASREINEALGSQIDQKLARFSFDGSLGETVYFELDGSGYIGKIVVVGLGDKDKYDLNALRKFVSTGVREAAGKLKARDIMLVPHTPGGVEKRIALQAAVEAAKLSTYEFLQCKSDPKPKYNIDELQVVSDSPHPLNVTEQKGIELGEIFADAQILARDLVNTPADDLTPADLADRAKEIARSAGLNDIEIFGPREIERHNMGGVLAVSKGSDKEPRFIVIRYRPEGAKEHIALVGKGVTFDAGGLSLKTPEGMMDMKCDMGGAAAVLGTMSAITKINPKVAVTAIIPAVENMLGAGAFKLGDVVRSMSGKKFEIHNTDAEGRVILGDGLHWAVDKEKADKVFDYATLTGACMVALGENYTGIMTNNDELAAKVIEAGKHTGEKMWQLPLDDELRAKIDGDVADFNNTGNNRYGGAITAAAFLEKFVADKKWVHHDIAGPAFLSKGNHLGPSGATGVPVRTNLHFLSTHYSG
ncbi:MAG: leucyl aminopeptidase [Candidatus Melainabacteria bacterium]|nr:leucyl aminopeptidase [Candidatus Melainabacteria bacterium]MBI3308025.1 leucyl aminopeptidase [Candidatus Melainabacteria bacterium]